jgi:hypothetical protein
MKMKNILSKLFMLIFMVSFFSCETMDDYEVEYSPVWPLAGEWWVTYSVDGSQIGGHSKLYTYNTAADVAEEMWVDGTFANVVGGSGQDLPYKFKVVSNPAETSFSASNVENTVDGTEFSVSNGTVIEDGGTSIIGVTTDSIAFEMTVADPAAYGLNSGDVILVSGIRRTGFLEDDY